MIEFSIIFSCKSENTYPVRQTLSIKKNKRLSTIFEKDFKTLYNILSVKLVITFRTYSLGFIRLVVFCVIAWAYRKRPFIIILKVMCIRAKPIINFALLSLNQLSVTENKTNLSCKFPFSTWVKLCKKTHQNTAEHIGTHQNTLAVFRCVPIPMCSAAFRCKFFKKLNELKYWSETNMLRSQQQCSLLKKFQQMIDIGTVRRSLW